MSTTMGLHSVGSSSTSQIGAESKDRSSKQSKLAPNTYYKGYYLFIY